jgi:hypothetical protein
LQASNASFKRKVVEKIGNIDDKNLTNVGEDVEFFLRARYHGKLMSKWFLLPPLHWGGILIRDLKNFLKKYFIKLTGSIAKFIGFILSSP